MLKVASPAAHQQGTLTLLGMLAGDPLHPCLVGLRRFVLRPLLDPRRAEDAGLKFDLYRSLAPGTLDWGIAISQCYEPQSSFEDGLLTLANDLGGGPDLAELRALQALFDVRPEWTVGIGMGGIDQRARWKLYLQEERWGRGISQLGAMVEKLGDGETIQIWISPGLSVGVASVELGGRRGARFYMGGADPHTLLRGGPLEAWSEPLRGLVVQEWQELGWYYLTLRLGAVGRSPYAINRVFNVIQAAFSERRGVEALWREARAWFEYAGQEAAFDAILASTRSDPKLLVCPSALALEPTLQGGLRADLYLAAWQRA